MSLVTKISLVGLAVFLGSLVAVALLGFHVITLSMRAQNILGIIMNVGFLTFFFGTVKILFFGRGKRLGL